MAQAFLNLVLQYIKKAKQKKKENNFFFFVFFQKGGFVCLKRRCFLHVFIKRGVNAIEKTSKIN